MSADDDPFGSGGKTVIRPNPGGAGPAPSPSPSPPQGAAGPIPVPGAPPVPPPSPARAHDATVFSPQPARAPAPPAWQPAQRGGHGMPEVDAWMKPAAAQKAFFPGQGEPAPQPQAPAQKIPLEVALTARDGAEYAAANPITTAAAPLLILLGRLRLMIVDMQAVPLMTYVANSIREFERKVLAAGVPKEDAMIAKYALCGTADDIVQNLPGTDRQVWLQYSMLAQFFQVRTSGVGFFEELQKILANPAPRYDLLELMHACLSLGFEGQYRGAAGGDRDLQRIRRDVYETLRHLRARNDDDISPRWRGVARSMANMSSQIPLWAIASVVAAGLVGVYFLLRLIIGGDSDDLARKLLALNPGGPVSIERAAFFEPFEPQYAATGQLERIRAALADEIGTGQMAVDQKGSNIVVEINNLLLFASGSADVVPAFQPIAARVAAALDAEPGPIGIVGHTDNVPLRRTSAFKSNYDLSLARAASVETVIAPHLSDPARVEVTGKGEDEPVANNTTAEGRARNRRVEIMIPEERSLAAASGIVDDLLSTLPNPDE